MRIQKTLAALCSLFVAQWLTLAAFAVEVTEPAGAAHGYPGLCDINGKKLADSEFRQWVENNRLHVVITHKFSAGEVYEEQAQFRQQPELIQEKWSWKESKHGRSQREFAVDFMAAGYDSYRPLADESPAHTSARIIRMCPKGSVSNRGARLPGLGSALP